MNKQQLIEWVHSSDKLGGNNTKAAAQRAVDTVIEGIKYGLQKGDTHSVSVVGFGSFQVKRRKARMGKNPRTGAAIKIPAQNTVTFRPGKDLKDRVKRVRLGK